MAGVSVCINDVVLDLTLLQRHVSRSVRRIQKRLGLKLAHQSKKTSDDFHECTSSFQPDLNTNTGGKQKLSVCWFKILYCKIYFLTHLTY